MQVPNWFRWLIIIVATLIMCACRAPMQEGVRNTPLFPGDLSGQQPAAAPSNRTVIQGSLAEKAAAMAQQSQFSGYVAAPTNTASVQGQKRQREIGKIESLLTEDTEPATATAVYASPAAGNANAGSFEGVTVSFEVQDEPQQADSDAKSGGKSGAEHVVQLLSQPILSASGTSARPQDIALASCDEPMLVCPTTPYEQYLPMEDIPVENNPQRWAVNPFACNEFAQRNLRQSYPDEYICDGGDRNGQVTVLNDWSLRNLDPEDTIGHYDTLDNQLIVEPSNRVCVYAPRFVSARKVTAAFENLKRDQPFIADKAAAPITDGRLRIADQYSQTLSPQRHLLVQPPSSLRVRLPGVEAVHRQPVSIAILDLSAHEDFRVMKLGIHKQTEKARLAEFTANAITWTHDKAVQVVIDEEVAQTQMSRKGVETLHFIDNGPPKMRVIKTASTSDALPGEEIEFTLRFDNIGYQTIGNVTIVDNLTTRLEFIEGSDLCSEECNFVADYNDVDSLTLRWEIINPVKAGQGGLIRFRCRLR